MNISGLLIFYGAFLIVCGIVSVTFIGKKAKTALLSGGISGIISLYSGWLLSTGSPVAPWLGIFLSIALFIVFSWRSAKTLFQLFEMIRTDAVHVNGKGIAFLIISLMAVVSFVVFLLQVISL